MLLPLYRVIELGYCREYYQSHDPSVISPGGDVDEMLCKQVPEVQQSVAKLYGMIESFHVLCGMLPLISFSFALRNGYILASALHPLLPSDNRTYRRAMLTCTKTF